MSDHSSNSPKPGKLLLEEINQLDAVKCGICNGYIIDATSISECLHTFCRSCIVLHIWRGFLNCPTCHEEIHKTRPLLNLRHDPVKQELIYRLVPGLQEREIARRKAYLEEHENDFPNAVAERMQYDNLIPLPKKMSFKLRSIFGLGVKLSEKSDQWREVTGKYRESYLRMSVSATFGVLEQFIRNKSGDSISEEAFILMIFREMVFNPEDTLSKVLEYDPDPSGEIVINFAIYVDKFVTEVKAKPKPIAIELSKPKTLAIASPKPKPFTLSEPVSKKPKLIAEAVVVNTKQPIIEENKVAAAVIPRQTKPARRKNRPPTKIPMNHYHEPAHDPLGDIMSKGLTVPSNPIKTSSKPRPVSNIPNRPNGTKPSPSSSGYRPFATASGCYRPIRPAHKVAPPQQRNHNFPSGIDLGRMDGHAAASLAQQLDQSRHTDRVAPIKLVMSPQSSKANDTNERHHYVIVSPSDSNEGREVITSSTVATASVTSATSSRPFPSPVIRQPTNNNNNILSDLLSKPIAAPTQNQQQMSNIQQRHQISNEMKAKPNRRKQKLIKPTHITAQSYEEEPPRLRMKEPESDSRNHNRQHHQQVQYHQHQQQHQHAQQQNNNNKAKRPEVCHMNVSFNEAKSRKPPVAVPMTNNVARNVTTISHQQDNISMSSQSINMAINNFNNNATSFGKQSVLSTYSSHQQNADELRNKSLRNNTDAEAHRIALERARKVMKDMKDSSSINTSASTAAARQPPPPKKQNQRKILPKPQTVFAVPLIATASHSQITNRQQQQQHHQPQPQKKFPSQQLRQPKGDFLEERLAQHRASLDKMQQSQFYTTNKKTSSAPAIQPKQIYITNNNKTSSGPAGLLGMKGTCLISRNDLLRSSSTATSSSISTLSNQSRHSLGRVRSVSYKDQIMPSTTRRLSSGSSGASMASMSNPSNGRTFEYRVSSSSTSSSTSFTGGKHNLPNVNYAKSLQQQRTSFPSLKRSHQSHQANSSFVPTFTKQQRAVAPVASSSLEDILQRNNQGPPASSSGLRFSSAMTQRGPQQRASGSSRSNNSSFPLAGTKWVMREEGLIKDKSEYLTVGDQQNLAQSNRLSNSFISLSSSSHSCQKDINTGRTSSSSSIVIPQAHDPELPLDFSKRGKY